MFRIEDANRSRARVRVTGRALSEPSATGVRLLLAAPGVELPLDEALTAGIPVGLLEAASPAAVAALAKLSDGPAAVDDQDDVAEDTVTGDDTDADGWPKHRGGPYWELSDGTRFKGSRDDAADAQAELDG